MPPARKDSLSPATGASLLQRTPSTESLNAHPLLSSSPPSSPVPPGSKQDSLTSTQPRYVPYTPRHRPPASVATGTTAHAPPPVVSNKQQEGAAASKLHVQKLKAAAQRIGLGSGTVGWAMLERLVDAEHGSEWDEIWSILVTAKPTLLLPLEPISEELITPELFKEHIAFCNNSNLSSSVVTLSGLRGTINDSVLTFHSTLSTYSKQFLDLLKSDSRNPVLNSLPPLPSYPSTAASSLSSFALPASTALPLPPRSRPPLPPRPVASPSAPTKSQGASRITIPFASLFTRPPASSNSSPSSTPRSQGTPHTDEVIGGLEISTYSIGKKISRESVGRELSMIIEEEIKAELAGCPTWVVDHVLNFTGPLHPIPRAAKEIDVHPPSSTAQTDDVHFRRFTILPPSTQPSPDPSFIAEAFQDFYLSMEDNLKASCFENSSIGQVSNDEMDPEKDRFANDVAITEVLEKVESIMCRVFYDRTFRPLSGDDVSHDDALANRIAALSLLDLSLEHLGVEVPNEASKSGVNQVVTACGEILQRLNEPQHRSPRDKSALLIEAHKKIVDGLSRLPQLRLKPDHDFQDQTQKAPQKPPTRDEAARDALNDTSAPLHAPRAESHLNENSTATTSNSFPGDVTAPIPSTDSTSAQTLSEPSPESASSLPANKIQPDSQDASTDDNSNLLIIDHSRRISSATFDSLPAQHHSPSIAAISGDLLFPILIFSVVKANPAHLVSHLLYTQRFRSRNVGGQESYCLVNLMAVVEFLEHVDMVALGLGDSDRVMSTADLTPIPLSHGSIDSSTSPTSPFASRIGRRVNQQVEELAGLAGSANRVITGVVDSSFGVLRGFLTSGTDTQVTVDEVQASAPWNNLRPGFGLLRRGSGFSIANVAASLPGRSKTPAGEEGQQMIDVSSHPGSTKGEEEEDEKDNMSTSSTSGESLEGIPADKADTRSVRSFSSVVSRESRERDRAEGRERKSLTDRFANISALSRLGTSVDQQAAKPSPPSSRPTSWLPPASLNIQQTTDLSASPERTPLAHPRLRIPPPNRRFLECTEQDIRIGEVGELLREYRRMVQALQSAGAFDSHV